MPPIIDKNTKLLVLGSMPGEKSLENQQYYAHPRNQFWPLIFRMFDHPMVEDYQTRVSLLLKNRLGVWDVIQECNREGSLDADIMNETANDFESLFKQYPGITHVVFNGAKAYDTFRKKVGFSFENIVFHKLGSTSPAHAIPFEKRLRDWAFILDFLRDNKERTSE